MLKLYAIFEQNDTVLEDSTYADVKPKFFSDSPNFIFSHSCYIHTEVHKYEKRYIIKNMSKI